jgi:hypothetical protein
MFFILVVLNKFDSQALEYLISIYCEESYLLCIQPYFVVVLLFSDDVVFKFDRLVTRFVRL